MTFEEVGRGIGWIGGVLYLIQFIEHVVRQRLFLARVARENRKPRVAPPEPLRIHKLTCELCGENVGSDPYCKHPNAPEPEPLRIHKLTCELCGENVGSDPYCKHPNAPEQPQFIVTALPPR